MSREPDVRRAAIVCFAVSVGGVWILAAPPSSTDGLAFLSLCVLLACLYLGFREPTPLNPYLLFSFTPLSLLLYSSRVSTWYLVDLKPGTWALAIVNMVAFIAGLEWAARIPTRKRVERDNRSPRLAVHALTLLAIGVAPTLYGVIAGLPTLLSGDWLSMGRFAAAVPFASTLMLARYPAISFALKSGKRWLVVTTVSVAVLTLALNFNKSQMALLAMTVVVSLYRYHGRRPRARLWMRALVVALVVIGILSVGLFDIARSDFDSTQNLLRKGAAWQHGNLLLLPYMYFVSSWTNLDYVVTTQAGHTYGLWTIKPLLGYFGLDGSLGSTYDLVPYSNFNTFTFVGVQFKDFGFLGSAILSLLLGVLIGRLYDAHLASDSPLITAVYAVNAVAVLEMFFSNHFFSVGYPFTIMVLAAVYSTVFVRLPERIAARGEMTASGGGVSHAPWRDPMTVDGRTGSFDSADIKMRDR